MPMSRRAWGQFRVLAYFGPSLANESHSVGVAFPCLDTLQPLVAVLDRPQRGRVQVVGDEDGEAAIARVESGRRRRVPAIGGGA